MDPTHHHGTHGPLETPTLQFSSLSLLSVAGGGNIVPAPLLIRGTPTWWTLRIHHGLTHGVKNKNDPISHPKNLCQACPAHLYLHLRLADGRWHHPLGEFLHLLFIPPI